MSVVQFELYYLNFLILNHSFWRDTTQKTDLKFDYAKGRLHQQLHRLMSKVKISQTMLYTLQALRIVEVSDNIHVNEVFVAAKKYILDQVKFNSLSSLLCVLKFAHNRLLITFLSMNRFLSLCQWEFSFRPSLSLSLSFLFSMMWGDTMGSCLLFRLVCGFFFIQNNKSGIHPVVYAKHFSQILAHYDHTFFRFFIRNDKPQIIFVSNNNFLLFRVVADSSRWGPRRARSFSSSPRVLLRRPELAEGGGGDSI